MIKFMLKGCIQPNNSLSCTKCRFDSTRDKNGRLQCLDTCPFGYIKDKYSKLCIGKIPNFYK